MRQERDGWVIERGEDGYPAALEGLERPPEAIFGRGDPEAIQVPAIAVVGSRRATPYGLAVAEMAGRVTALCGAAVVSGGAMGCDHAAAQGALLVGGTSVIVAGTGADVVYPTVSADVFSKTVEHGGAVISAEPWGQGPRRWAFRKRNSLIAALGCVLVVTEAAAHSGTASTAEAAIELGRTVYGIPGSIFSPNSQGTNQLLAEGACIIYSEQDLATMLASELGSLCPVQVEAAAEVGAVMAALVASPLRPDELAARLGGEVLTTLRTLTDYEAQGIVERLPDGRYSPSRTWLLGQNGDPDKQRGPTPRGRTDDEAR